MWWTRFTYLFQFYGNMDKCSIGHPVSVYQKLACRLNYFWMSVFLHIFTFDPETFFGLDVQIWQIVKYIQLLNMFFVYVCSLVCSFLVYCLNKWTGDMLFIDRTTNRLTYSAYFCYINTELHCWVRLYRHVLLKTLNKSPILLPRNSGCPQVGKEGEGDEVAWRKLKSYLDVHVQELGHKRQKSWDLHG